MEQKHYFSDHFLESIEQLLLNDYYKIGNKMEENGCQTCLCLGNNQYKQMTDFCI